MKNPMAAFGRSVLFAAAVVLGIAQACAADIQKPDVLVKNTSEEMISIIAKTQDRQKLLDAVETKVVPHFNFAHMTQLALGRSWQQANPAQRQALEQAFRKLLVRTYTNAMATTKKREASVKVSPLSGAEQAKTIVVKSRVMPAGRQPIAVDYEMELLDDGWKVFDVIVDGISLVTNYRDSFANEIKTSGIDGLIKALNEKNRKSVTDELASPESASTKALPK